MAQSFDLIVVGAHVKGAMERLLLGSTAAQVVRHARCPVLVVREALPAGEEEARATATASA